MQSSFFLIACLFIFSCKDPQVSVDVIEKMTAINFFPKMEDTIENKLEKRNDYKEWSFN